MKKIFFALCVAVAAFAMNSCCSQPDLAGKWVVESIDGLEVAGTVESPFLEFDVEKGRVHGNTGVNLVNSTFTQNGKSLKFGMGATTMMAGPEAAMKMEQDFLKAFEAVASAKMKDGKLELADKDGNVVMVLTR